jgi:hypothetical protein
MKSLIFQELLLLSVSQKRARRIKFHRKATILSGDNATGKSQVLKSLYACFGALPAVPEELWNAAELKALLRFSNNGRNYSILHDRDSFTLFNESNAVLGVHRSVMGGLAKQLADLFDFRLQFYSKTDEARDSHPKYLFAPFYIDQDKGWTGPWASFARLSSSRRADALEYHVGIRPNDFYRAKAQFQQLQGDLAQPTVQRETLTRVFENIGTRIGNSDFNTDVQAFAEEIQILLTECKALQEREESFRDRLVALENDRLSLQSQADVTTRAAREIRKDFNFATSVPVNSVECPTCGALCDNDIVDHFLIAQDEDVCADLLSHLTAEISNIEAQIKAERDAYEATGRQLTGVNNALSLKQKELTLRDVIQAEGKRDLRDNISKEISTLDETLAGIESQMRESRRIMRAASDRRLKREILDQYRGNLQNFALRLQVTPLPPEMLGSVAPKIAAGSSEFPRRLMAYYFAILHTIRRNTSSTYCPVVVDTVNQQDQSDDNLRRMYELLANQLPEDTQLILACVDPGGVQFEGEIVKLDEKYGLLKAEEYQQTAEEIRQLIDLRVQVEVLELSRSGRDTEA